MFGQAEAPTSTIPVLLYHTVSPNAVQKGPDTLLVHDFGRQMRYLALRGYRCVGPEAVAEPRPPTGGRRTVCLTFDDGYESFLRLVYPVLRSYEFTATIFVVCDLVGRTATWDGGDGSRLLTWEQLRSLQEAGMRIGSHTLTHRRLTELGDDEIRRELIDSRAILAAELNASTPCLAYPFGASDERVRTLAKEAGYAAAFGVHRGPRGAYNNHRRQCLPGMTRLGFRLTLGSLGALHIRARRSIMAATRR